jgi:uncharacterized protein YndB with AHSA1/START domain
MRGSESIHIDAPPEAVWNLVSDITRMGEWSPETQSAAWTRGSSGPEVGATFAGRNRHGWTRWTGRCDVTVAEPGRKFAFVRRGPDGGATWSYSLEPEEGGTKVTEAFSQARASLLPLRIVNRMVFGPNREQMLLEGVRSTLQQLKLKAETQETPSS